jgi:hypothetical protein
MDTPYEQYHETLLAHKNLMERVNQHLAETPTASRPESIALIGIVLSVGTANIFVLLWLFVMLFVRSAERKMARGVGRVRRQIGVEEVMKDA